MISGERHCEQRSGIPHSQRGSDRVLIGGLGRWVYAWSSWETVTLVELGSRAVDGTAALVVDGGAASLPKFPEVDAC